VVVPKLTDPPAVMMVSVAGEVMVPVGGAVVWGVIWMNWATDGTPALSSRNSM